MAVRGRRGPAVRAERGVVRRFGRPDRRDALDPPTRTASAVAAAHRGRRLGARAGSTRAAVLARSSLASSLRADVAEGLRWLWRHRLLRTLAVTMAFGNLVFCAAFAIFVLYSRGAARPVVSVGYGVLLTTFAAGGLLGTLVAPRLLRVLGATPLLRAGLLIEVALHATLAATTRPLLAGAMIIVFGMHTVVWGVVVVTIRQRSVPSSMFGRVTSVYALLDLGGAALGSLLGGLVAQAYGLVATFWTAAAAMALVASSRGAHSAAATATFVAPASGWHVPGPSLARGDARGRLGSCAWRGLRWSAAAEPASAGRRRACSRGRATTSSSSAAEPDVLADAVKWIGPQATAVTADVSDPDQIAVVVEAVAGRPVDVLVNNAGAYVGGDDSTPAARGRALAGHLRLERASPPSCSPTRFVPLLRRPGGRIILISSIAAQRGGGGPYSAAKAALHGFVFDLATRAGPGRHHRQRDRTRLRHRQRVLRRPDDRGGPSQPGGRDAGRAAPASRTTSPRRSAGWPDPAAAMSPARSSTSTVARSWAADASRSTASLRGTSGEPGLALAVRRGNGAPTSGRRWPPDRWAACRSRRRSATACRG